jgi:hypothetical protein
MPSGACHVSTNGPLAAAVEIVEGEEVTVGVVLP